ncbi:MAG: polysaccharide biosynthesis/export family protein [Bacteroidota bacterium]|nr:polysaccharide biosynthesis/export family protein [Bacteroidota bacterium]
MTRQVIAILSFALLVAFSSCTTNKQLTYLQNVDSLPQGSVYYKQAVEYRIQNEDILYIRVISLNDEINTMINTFSSQTNMNQFQNEISLYLYGYSVNDSGYVDVPYIGNVNVLGLTLEEAKQIIKERVEKSVRNATVIVKLVSFKFSVLGEVQRPGVYKNYNNQLTILEALSMAGDITDYGDRFEVLVVRPTKDDTKTYRVDLTDKSLLSSEAFFLLPNDVVYVQPIKSKSFRINIPTMTLALTSISTLILVLSFIK